MGQHLLRVLRTELAACLSQQLVGQSAASIFTGGPKLRKWYGEGDLPVDGGNPIVSNMPEPEDIAPEDVERDAVLVTEADSPTGEQIVLQLILARYYTTKSIWSTPSLSDELQKQQCSSTVHCKCTVGCCVVPTKAYSFEKYFEQSLSDCAALQITYQGHHSRCRGGKKRVWALCHRLCRRCR